MNNIIIKEFENDFVDLRSCVDETTKKNLNLCLVLLLLLIFV